MELAISAIEITAHTTLPVVKTFQHLLLSSAKDLQGPSVLASAKRGRRFSPIMPIKTNYRA